MESLIRVYVRSYCTALLSIAHVFPRSQPRCSTSHQAEITTASKHGPPTPQRSRKEELPRTLFFRQRRRLTCQVRLLKSSPVCTDLTTEAPQCTSSRLLAQTSLKLRRSAISRTSEPSLSAARARILLAKTVPPSARSCLVLCEVFDP